MVWMVTILIFIVQRPRYKCTIDNTGVSVCHLPLCESVLLPLHYPEGITVSALWRLKTDDFLHCLIVFLSASSKCGSWHSWMCCCKAWIKYYILESHKNLDLKKKWEMFVQVLASVEAANQVESVDSIEDYTMVWTNLINAQHTSLIPRPSKGLATRLSAHMHTRVTVLTLCVC